MVYRRQAFAITGTTECEELDTIKKIYPSHVGPGTTSNSISLNPLRISQSKKTILVERIREMNEKLGNPISRFGENLFQVITRRIMLYNLYCDLPKLPAGKRSIPCSFHNKVTALLENVGDKEFQKVTEELVYDAVMLLDVIILASMGKAGKFELSRVHFEELFDMVTTEFFFVGEYCDEQELRVLRLIFGEFLNQQQPLINNFTLYIIEVMRVDELKDFLGIPDSSINLTFQCAVNANVLLYRIGRLCSQPFTIKDTPCTYMTDNLRAMGLISYMNLVKVSLSRVPDLEGVMWHLKEQISKARMEKIDSAIPQLCLLHFGVSSHGEYLVNKIWLQHCLGEELIKAYEDELFKPAVSYSVMSFNACKTGPFQKLTEASISYGYHPFAAYKTETSPSPNHFFPQYLLDYISSLSAAQDDLFEMSLMRIIHRVKTRFNNFVQELVQTFDAFRLQKYTKVIKFGFPALDDCFHKLAKAIGYLELMYRHGDTRNRFIISRLIGHIKDLGLLYRSAGFSGDIYDIKFSPTCSSDNTFLSRMMIQAIITGQRLCTGKSLFPTASGITLFHYIRYIYKQRSVMMSMGVWDQVAEHTFQTLGPHMHKHHMLTDK
jgi:hypothetical protein